MKKLIPTVEEIKKEVYSNVFNETSEDAEWFIKGMIYMRDKWIKTLDNE